MAAAPSITHRSIDQLETDLITRSQRVNASEHEFLVDLREFDLRQGWKAYHFNHCAEWLNLKCGLSPSAGREKVRVAHGMWDLPLLSAAMQSGELSYSKVRALTRVATPANEAGLLEYAMGHTAEQVENHCRALRNGQRDISTQDSNRIHKSRYLSSCRHGDGRMTISVELGQEEGELVMKALERAMAVREREDRSEEHEVDPSAEGWEEPSRSETFFANCADALVAIATAYLAGGNGKTTCSADHYQVVVHVDEAALRMSTSDGNTSAEAHHTHFNNGDPSAEGSGVNGPCSDLPIESVRRLCCDGSLVAVTRDERGNPVSVSRKNRVVQPALKRALLARDRCCQYPGCTHKRHLHAHHIRHWIDGGETSLENTILLCSAHHRLLHEGGFSIKTNYRRERYFETSQGKVVSQAPVFRLKDDEDYQELLQHTSAYKLLENDEKGIAEERAIYRTSAEVRELAESAGAVRLARCTWEWHPGVDNI